jgi:hypothetical protein
MNRSPVPAGNALRSTTSSYRLAWPSATRFKRALAVTCLALLGASPGCGLNGQLVRLGQNVGSSAASSAADGGLSFLRSEPGREAIRAITDSTTASLSLGVQRELTPLLNGAVEQLTVEGQGLLRSTRDTLAASIEGQLSAALRTLLQANIQAAGEESRGQIQLLTAQLGTDLERSIFPALSFAVGQAVDTAMVRLATAAGGSLRVAVDTIVGSAVRTGLDQARTQGEPIWRRILLGSALVALTLMGIAIFWLWRDRRRRGEALFAVAQAINDAGAKDVKASVKRQARDQRIEGYLNTFLEENRLL